ncbi:MAG: rhodanese-like domain-containing protein [Candidatus Zixiibacteriota bacterium]
MEDLQLQDVSGSISRIALLVLLGLATTLTVVCVNGSVPTVTVEELARLAADSTSNIFLLDVRTTGEWKDGHLSFADLRVPYDSLDVHTDLLPTDRSTPIYCFCRTGRRSGIAARRLIEMGYLNVFNVDGGIRAWTGAGYKIVTEK